MLTYLTSGYFPQPKASSLQIIQMCAAFAQCSSAVCLLHRGKVLTDSALTDFYAVAPTFARRTVPVAPLPFASRLYQLQLAWQAYRLSHQQPASGGKPAWLAFVRGRDVLSALAASYLGATVCYEAHGRPASLREAALLRRLHNRPNSWIVALTPAIRDCWQREYGFATHRWLIAPDGVDLARFEPPQSRQQARATLGLPNDRCWVVYVGGLYAGRGLETLFAAMHGQPASLLVVGGHNPQEIAEWQARAAQANVAVQFTGFQPPLRVPLYLQAADILAMPYSRQTRTAIGEDTTAFMSPLKLFEYMAAARPIIASDLPALRTVLTDRRNALLAAPDDSASLAQCVAALCQDAALGERLAAQARQDVQAYTWQARAANILKAIRPIPNTPNMPL